MHIRRVYETNVLGTRRDSISKSFSRSDTHDDRIGETMMAGACAVAKKRKKKKNFSHDDGGMTSWSGTNSAMSRGTYHSAHGRRAPKIFLLLDARGMRPPLIS
ncbi:uncharacterized protein LOC143365437 [Halictus rubicundus]|uniref:uncharacterized protein LOC143365437 n=1 Tax=Halictus rubicundus TaxID=77578 RepID=UPI0040361FC3